jgi:hypothetical protein
MSNIHQGIPSALNCPARRLVMVCQAASSAAVQHVSAALKSLMLSDIAETHLKARKLLPYPHCR